MPSIRLASRATNATAAFLLAAAFVLPAAGTSAQPQPVDDFKARIWELPLGTPVADIPARYFDPHCGTNGGPPSLRLDSFADFARCRPDPVTGLYEVWFTEDDETEYVGLAYRSQYFAPGPFAANVFVGHKVIFSLLIDGAGLVQGYRVFTDPREPTRYREIAEAAGDALMGIYGFTNFTCTDLDPLPGETEIEGRFLKRQCVAVVDGRHVTIERHYFRKPGQRQYDPVTGLENPNYFESSTRLEVIAEALVQP
ncbi:MAG: hypothetical protein IT534_10545 [Bauldia sp.]|nr:hypothetical protein [Bauldia sp.]